MFALVTLALISALLAAEARWPAQVGPSDWAGNVRAYALVLLVQAALLPAVVLGASTSFTLVDLAGWPLIPGALAFLVVMDLGEFCFHRAQHASPLLWRMHAVHHSDPNMGVLTTARHFWGDQLLKAVTIWPLAGLLLKPTGAMVAIYMAVGLYHYFVHANLRIGFGRWSWLLNSPAYHRRHHSIEREHYNCNFAALLPILDVICGTYRRPDGFPATGLEKRPTDLMAFAVWPLRAE